MKHFLTVTSMLEALAGLAFVIMPAKFILILLGTTVTDPSSLIIARLAGLALITIAIACWLSRDDGRSFVMAKAMTVYNLCCVSLLVYALFFEQISGQGLWPAIMVHFVMMLWGVQCLWKKEI